MALVVQKYGGSSLTDPTAMKRIAARVVEERRKGNRMVVVVSAMGDTTDHLIELARQVSSEPPEREMDMLLSVGERVSIALLAMAISDLGYQAISFTGSQVGIITDNRHTEARILEVRGLRIREALEEGKIVIVAGFQGVSINKEITTLGRGGTDTTALALAAALHADRCEIMKDVDGIYVAEPKLVPQPRLNEQVSYEEMIEMANMGAGVLKTESVEIARHYQVKIAVGNSMTGRVGTIITDAEHDAAGIRGVIGQKELCYLRIAFDDPQQVRQLHRFMCRRRIKTQAYLCHAARVEMVVQQRFSKELKLFLHELAGKGVLAEPHTREGQGMAAIIGSGLNFNSGLFNRIMDVVVELPDPPQFLQINDIRISWMLPEEQVDQTIRTLYDALVEAPRATPSQI